MIIIFIRMPTQSIWIDKASESSDVSRIANSIREKHQNFLPIIATITTKWNDYSEILKSLSLYRINKTNQYKPHPFLIDLINSRHDNSGFFNNLREVEAHETVVEFIPNSDYMQVAMGKRLENSLLIEGARQSVNPMDILRELAEFYVRTREAIARGEWEKAEKIAEDVNRYFLKGRDRENLG